MNQVHNKPIVAIDGPVATGKSSVAKGVAEKMKLLYIDTGAMYRAITLAALRAGIDLKNRKDIARIARESEVELKSTPKGLRTFLNGEDVSEEIRSPEVSRATSPISETPEVRTRLVELQRAMGSTRGVVMEGRDIGTVVFPDADFKFFLTADPMERARRRSLQMKGTAHEQDVESVLDDLKERDRRDTTREIAPLRRADDAVEIDTTELTLGAVIDKISGIILKGNP